jgi:quinol monooxygenase YgiN
MIKVIFHYNVAVEKRQGYLQSTRKEIKPFWESHGCLSYEVWQRSDDERGFVKEMVFQDGASMKKALSLQESEPIKALFYQFATDIVRMTCEKKI